MKTAAKKSVEQKDGIDALVDNLDKYYFRMGTAENVIGGSEYSLIDNDWLGDIRAFFETPTVKKAREGFYKIAREAEAKIPGILGRLEDAACNWQAAEDTFPMLLGFVIGLRIAGIPSDRTKEMARTWRLGYPQDDNRRTDHR